MNPKERLEAVLRHRPVDRPPVICPGGMMNAAVIETMEGSAFRLPGAHSSEEQMAGLAAAVWEKTGFENIGLPFCMTIEAENLGSRVDMGSLTCEPKIEKEARVSVNDVPVDDVGARARVFLGTGRVPVVLGAISRAAAAHPTVPVIGVVTGPLSAAASVVDPVTFFKELHKNREGAHRVVDHVSFLISALATKMIGAGASVVTIADPSASGEILGPDLFREYAVPCLNRIVDAVHAASGLAIVHICGDMKRALAHLDAIRADALSFDSVMSLPRIKAEHPHFAVMGNVSTALLASGSGARALGRISGAAEKLVREGVDIIAPACGLDLHTPLAAIRALTGAVTL